MVNHPNRSKKAERTIRLLIPAAVVYHWQPKFDDLVQHGVTCASDATYQKIVDALAVGKLAYIQANVADLIEIEAECANWLEGETDVSIGRDPEDRRIRAGYQRLSAAVAAVLQH